MQSICQSNILLVGDTGVGKSTFITRHQTGEFQKNYIPHIPLKVTSLSFYANTTTTTESMHVLHIYETNNSAYFPDLPINAVILMFDHSSVGNLSTWYENIRNSYNDVLIIFCRTKVDIQPHFSTPLLQLNFVEPNVLRYYRISSKTNVNFIKPFLDMLRKQYNFSNLTFLESPAVIPPTACI